MTSPQVPLRPGERIGAELYGRAWGQPRPFDPAAESTTFMVPTLLMRQLAERGAMSNLPLFLPPGVIANLAAGAQHVIARAHLIHEDTPGGASYEWVRAHTMMKLSGQDGSYDAWLDYDAEFFGKLIDAQERSQPQPQPQRGRAGVPIVPDMPRWVGTHSFEPVYRRATEIAQMNQLFEGEEALSPRQVMGISETTFLSEAHVLCIDPGQVAVLPEWEDPQEVYDYAAEAVLPFEPLFLDLSGPGGIAAEFTAEDPLHNLSFSLRGAVVWRQVRDSGPVLMVAPYGWPTTAASYFPVADDDYRISQFESPGWFVFGEQPFDSRSGKAVLSGEVKLGLHGTSMYGNATTCWGSACANIPESDGRNLPGYAILPFSFDQLRDAVRSGEGDDTAQNVLMWGQIIWTAAAKALAALSITEAVEVEFVDAPVERRVAKRAAKRRWRIAQQVVIRSHTKRYRDHNTTGAEARYSHRFWRRATVAHYPLGTRMADATPDLVTPCKRPPESNCGFCRKVKRPACIVGPEDKPLVLKTLVKRKG